VRELREIGKKNREREMNVMVRGGGCQTRIAELFRNMKMDHGVSG
jgi:hypothetical protein